jgi:hypothetical protein
MNTYSDDPLTRKLQALADEVRKINQKVVRTGADLKRLGEINAEMDRLKQQGGSRSGPPIGQMLYSGAVNAGTGRRA